MDNNNSFMTADDPVFRTIGLTANGALYRGIGATVNNEPGKLKNFVDAFTETAKSPLTDNVIKLALEFRKTILRKPAVPKFNLFTGTYTEPGPKTPSQVMQYLQELASHGITFSDTELTGYLRQALHAYYLAELREDTRQSEEEHQSDAEFLTAQLSNEELLMGVGYVEVPKPPVSEGFLLVPAYKSAEEIIPVLASSYDPILFDIGTDVFKSLASFSIDSIPDLPGKWHFKTFPVRTRRQRKQAENALVYGGRKRWQAREEVRVARYDPMGQKLGMFIDRTKKDMPINIDELPDFLGGPGRFCENLAKWLAYRNFDDYAIVQVTLWRIQRGGRFAAEVIVRSGDNKNQYIVDTTSEQNAALFPSADLHYQEWLFVAGECQGSKASPVPFTAETTIFKPQ